MKLYTITIDGNRIFCEDGLWHKSVAICDPHDTFDEGKGAMIAIKRCKVIEPGDSVILPSRNCAVGMWNSHIRYMLHFYDRLRHAFPDGYIDRVVTDPSEVRKNAHYIYDGDVDDYALLIDKATRKIVLAEKIVMIHA